MRDLENNENAGIPTTNLPYGSIKDTAGADFGTVIYGRVFNDPVHNIHKMMNYVGEFPDNTEDSSSTAGGNLHSYQLLDGLAKFIRTAASRKWIGRTESDGIIGAVNGQEIVMKEGILTSSKFRELPQPLPIEDRVTVVYASSILVCGSTGSTYYILDLKGNLIDYDYFWNGTTVSGGFISSVTGINYVVLKANEAYRTYIIRGNNLAEHKTIEISTSFLTCVYNGYVYDLGDLLRTNELETDDQEFESYSMDYRRDGFYDSSLLGFDNKLIVLQSDDSTLDTHLRVYTLDGNHIEDIFKPEIHDPFILSSIGEYILISTFDDKTYILNRSYEIIDIFPTSYNRVSLGNELGYFYSTRNTLYTIGVVEQNVMIL